MRLTYHLVDSSGFIGAARFTSDGRKLLTFSSDSKARQWDVATGRFEKVLCSVDTADRLLPLGSGPYSLLRRGERVLLVDGDRSEVCSFYFFDTSHICVLPSGYYAGDKEGVRKLYYIQGSHTIGFDQLDLKYNRPDLVMQCLGRVFGNVDTALLSAYRVAYYKRLRSVGLDTETAGESVSVPEATLAGGVPAQDEQDSAGLRLHIQARDSVYPLSYLNVWINDVPLFGSRGRRAGTKKTLDTTISVSLSEGFNRIEYAVVDANGAQSYKSPFFIRYTPRQPVRKRVFFVGIGVDHFADSTRDLRWSVKDVRDMVKALRNKFREDLIVDTLTQQEVTRENIEGLKAKLSALSVDDEVVIQYSGHGLLDDRYDYYLSTYGMDFGHPETRGLPYESLQSLLDSIPPRKKLMLIDACHSGEVDKDATGVLGGVSAFGARGLTPVGNPGGRAIGLKNSFDLMEDIFVHVGRSTGATIIAAASGTQAAYEQNDLHNGVFTHCVLDALNGRGSLSVQQLKQTVENNVLRITNGKQTPTSREETNDVDWTVW